MRLVAVRQHLRRLRRRILQLDAMVGELLLPDCDRALAAVGAALAQPNDADVVREQLLESVIVDVRRTTQMHPWGSTMVREPLVESELTLDILEIPIETDGLPHSLSAVLTRSCASLDLDFELLRVKREASAKAAVYRARLNAIRTIPDAIVM
ncbi:MAG: hypothetical protein WD648_04300 [Planctomycetaceae bacterium]